uniref:Ig-like domain-containing protein n=1 Tax=Cyprinus carpio TaxID=7962 RepID=A0A8C2I656_CYPCA
MILLLILKLKFVKFYRNIFSCFTECHGEERVDQPDKNIAEFEGRSVTLQCKYKTTSSQPELFWYTQRANYFPKYILWRNKFGVKDNDAQFQERFDSEVSSDSVPLKIKNLRVSDSAVYYCALRPTETKTYICKHYKLYSVAHNECPKPYEI